MRECPHFSVKKNEINPEFYVEHRVNKLPKIVIDKINCIYMTLPNIPLQIIVK